MKQKAIIAIALVLCVAGIIAVIALNSSNSNTEGGQVFSDGTIVRSNVSVITSDTKRIQRPIEVTENSLIFAADPQYKTGDVVVAGIIDAAPYGFIRKVVKTIKEGERSVVKTEPEVLTDVFKEAHIVEYFELSDVDAEEIIADNLSFSPEQTYTAEQLPNMSSANSIQTLAASARKSARKKFEFEHEEMSGISLEGSVVVDIWLELKIDIVPTSESKSSIDYSVILHKKADGEFGAGYTAGMNAEFCKTLFEKESVKCFFVGCVPIVVTNKIEADLEGEASLDGTIGVDYSIGVETSDGFVYHSQTNKVDEINEEDFESGDVNWHTEANVKGHASAGIFSHLITKLYDAAGTDLSLGIECNLDGEIHVIPKSDAKGLNYDGSLDLSIGPKIEGKLIATVPIIDKQFAEQTLFSVSFPMWWEKHWPSDDNTNNTSADINLCNTYTTNKSDNSEYPNPGPDFQFDYPDNWVISSEEKLIEEAFNIMERDIFTNSNGVTITFMDASFSGTGTGRFLRKFEVSKVAESQFIPYYPSECDEDFSYLGKFVVAKIKAVGFLHMDVDSEYTEIDGNEMYAVVPESYIGTQIEQGHFGIYHIVSFPYPSQYSFTAEAPNGHFSAQDEKEVIAILSSFRVTN